MKIIAAYPCLGKTTIYQLNKDKCFDREFNESRSTLGMTQEQQDTFFDNCANIVRMQYQANYHKILFITEDERLLSRLEDLKDDIILVFPDADSVGCMVDYKKRVLERSGQAWWDRVLKPEIPTLSDRLKKYRREGWDLRLVDEQRPYIEDVVDLPEDFVLPNYKKSVCLSNIRVVAFDFDDTLALHADPDYTEHRGDGDKYFIGAHEDPENFYDHTEKCYENPQLKNIVGYCRLNGIPMYCISKMRFSLHMKAKENFIKSHYGDDIEFIMASSQEIKNDVLRILCKINLCEPSNVLFIDDLKENVARASDAGYTAVKAPWYSDDSWCKKIMVSDGRSLFEYMDD